MPAPTLDGFATGIHTGAGTVSATLTTTQANDIIVVAFHCELNSNQPWGTSISGAGLTWQLRSRASNAVLNAQYRQTIELWWAVAASPLSAQAISVTSNITYDDATMVAFGVSGCNTTNPWDANPSIPAQDTTASTPGVTGVSTTNANDFLIYAIGTFSSINPGTNPPTGFTMVANAINGGGANFSQLSVAYQGVTTQQSNQTVSWGSSPSNCITLFDVLTADAGGVAVTPGVVVEYIAPVTGASIATLPAPVCAPSAGDTVLLCIYNYGPSQAASGVSGGGLTWTQRIRSHGSAAGSLEVWTAPSAAALGSANVTVTWTASATAIVMAVLALKGATAAIFDANAGLPAHQSDTAGTGMWTPSVTISTSQADDIVLMMLGASGTNNNMNTIPTGFRILTYTANGIIGIQRRNATLSGAVIAYPTAITGEATGTGAAGEFVVDALTADAPVVGGAGQARVMVLA